MTPTTRDRLVRLAIGLAVSAVAAWLVLRRVSLGEIAEGLAGVRWGWVAAMPLAKTGLLALKDRRWRRVLRSMAGPSVRGTFGTVCVGYFGNLVLPFKLGEVLRAALLRKRNPEVPLGGALATVATERVLDGAVLAVLVAGALPFAPVPPWVRNGTALLLVAMLLAIVLGMLTPLHRAVLRLLPEAGLLSIFRWGLRSLSAGTAVLRRPGHLAQAVGWTASVWLAEAFFLWLALRALATSVGYSGAVVVTLLYSIGLMIPSAPVQLGTHQALAVLFLEPFGVDAATAVSVSLVLQAANVLVLGTLGGSVLVREASAGDLLGLRTPPASG